MSNKHALDVVMERVYGQSREKVINFLTKAGAMVEAATKRKFKEQTIYGTGTTAATILSIVEETPEEITCRVGSPSKVFAFRELGTSAHKTDNGSQEFVESVTRWCKRLGMTDEETAGVIYHIRKNGTKPKPSLMPAFYELQGQIEKMAKDMLT